jgi:hypothetical protein
MIVARLPPAEEPPVAILDTSTPRLEGPSAISQRRASQQSWTAAGQRFSGARLIRGIVRLKIILGLGM